MLGSSFIFRLQIFTEDYWNYLRHNNIEMKGGGIMMKRIRVLVTTIIIIALITGCAQQKYIPEKVDIRGKITQNIVNNNKEILGIILVEGKLEDDTQVDKASVSVTAKTKIFVLKNGETLEKADYSFLQEGQEVEVIFTGPVRESYPVQADAGKIIIKASSPQDEPATHTSNGVELKINKNVLSAGETMNLTIDNNSGSLISFGRPYMFEIYKDGQWSEYPLELAFTLELIIIDPGKTFDQSVLVDKLETGKYRILKYIRIENKDIDIKLVKEFDIK